MAVPDTAADRSGPPDSGDLRDGGHRFAIRVYYADTDAGGIVYHANYLGFLERARTEMLRRIGITHAGLQRETGLAMAVADCSVQFLRPARLDDALMIHTTLADVKGATMRAEQTVLRDGQVLVRAQVRIACIDREGRPRRVPETLRRALARISENRTAGGDGTP